MNTNSVGGAGGASGAGYAGEASGKQDPATMRPEQIVKELMYGRPDPLREKALIDELMKHSKPSEDAAGQGQAAGGPSGAQGAGGPSGSGEDEQSIQELLKKLKEGTISKAELLQLGKMLGIDPEELAKMNPKVANNLKENDGDIQGG